MPVTRIDKARRRPGQPNNRCVPSSSIVQAAGKGSVPDLGGEHGDLTRLGSTRQDRGAVGEANAQRPQVGGGLDAARRYPPFNQWLEADGQVGAMVSAVREDCGEPGIDLRRFVGVSDLGGARS